MQGSSGGDGGGWSFFTDPHPLVEPVATLRVPFRDIMSTHMPLHLAPRTVQDDFSYCDAASLPTVTPRAAPPTHASSSYQNAAANHSSLIPIPRPPHLQERPSPGGEVETLTASNPLPYKLPRQFTDLNAPPVSTLDGEHGETGEGSSSSSSTFLQKGAYEIGSGGEVKKPP